MGSSLFQSSETPDGKVTFSCKQSLLELLIPKAQNRFNEAHNALEKGMLPHHGLNSFNPFHKKSATNVNIKTIFIKQEWLHKIVSSIQSQAQVWNNHDQPTVSIDRRFASRTWATAAFTKPTPNPTTEPGPPTQQTETTLPTNQKDIEELIEKTGDALRQILTSIKSYPTEIETLKTEAANVLLKRMTLEALERWQTKEGGAMPLPLPLNQSDSDDKSVGGFQLLVPVYNPGPPPTITEEVDNRYIGGVNNLKVQLNRLRQEESQSLSKARQRSVEQAEMIRLAENYLHDFLQISAEHNIPESEWPSSHKSLLQEIGKLYIGSAQNGEVQPQFNPPEWAWHELDWKLMSNEIRYFFKKNWVVPDKALALNYLVAFKLLSEQDKEFFNSKKISNPDKIPIEGVAETAPQKIEAPTAKTTLPQQIVVLAATITVLTNVWTQLQTLEKINPFTITGEPLWIHLKSDVADREEQKTCVNMDSEEKFQTCSLNYAHKKIDLKASPAERKEKVNEIILKLRPLRTDSLAQKQIQKDLEKSFKQGLIESDLNGPEYLKKIASLSNKELLLDPQFGYLRLKHAVVYEDPAIREAARKVVEAANPQARQSAMTELRKKPEAVPLANTLQKILDLRETAPVQNSAKK